MVSVNPRQVAIETLNRNAKKTGYIEEILNQRLDRVFLSGKDRALARELTLGICRWRLTLEWLATRKLHRNPPEDILNVIILGLYQMYWMDRIPLHAVVYETVKLLDTPYFTNSSSGGYKKLVNAILRSYGRELEETRTALRELRQKNPALACSHPSWIYDRWKRQLGADNTLKLMDWNNTIPQPILRTNTLRIKNRETLLNQLIQNEIDVHSIDVDFLNEQLMLGVSIHVAPGRLVGYKEGSFYIQDPATLLSVQILDPQPDDVVLDHCAAPGGKTTYIAQKMRNQGRIVAVDVSERLHLISENCDRLGVNIVETIPARKFKEKTPVLKFDKILLDVPCSNTGVFRRRVEARYRLNMRELESLKKTQAMLLEHASHCLKVGGRLVYSTCSIDGEENDQQIDLFLDKHTDFQLEIKKLILPYETGTDGAFVASLIKK